MEALVLSCGTGGGHDAAARAVCDSMRCHGVDTVMLNPYTLVSDKTANTINRTYIGTVQRAPRAFGVIYKAGNIYRRLPVRSPVYHANRKMANVLSTYLQTHHFDIIVTTHVFPAEIITQMKNHGMVVPKSIFVATDYACIPFTEETNCDAYVIPTQEHIPEFVSRRIPREKLYPFGIPVGADFHEDISKAEAREKLGLEINKKYILLCGGSMGAGDLRGFVRKLLRNTDEQTEIIAICGSNEGIYGEIERLADPRIILLHYTDKMALYMKACDVFLSKPGGLSSTEAAVAGVPLVHLPPIPGCESTNAEFFNSHALSIKTTSHRFEVKMICSLLGSETEQKNMIDRQKKVIPSDSGEKIYELACRMTGVQ